MNKWKAVPKIEMILVTTKKYGELVRLVKCFNFYSVGT